jgi:murein DD-endopeptidase MepM/ murein hydrolase activator NlpD
MRAFVVAIALPFLASPAPAIAAGISLGLPIACTPGHDCWIQQYPDHDPSGGAVDYMCGAETYDGHDGVDIRVRDTAMSVAVIASAAGTVKAVRDGMADRLVRTETDRQAIAGRECGNGVVIAHDGGWETQYCHMKRGTVAVTAGERVAAGEVLGFVGYSGFAAFPHVHLAVRENGRPRDPFRREGATCGGPADPLWSADVRPGIAYRRGDIIRTGFAADSVTMEDLEEGRLADRDPDRNSPAAVAYGWAINLEKDDVVRVAIDGPDGLSAANEVRLDRPKAQYMLFAGRKRPAAGWPPGRYRGRLEVVRNGAVWLSRDWQAELR